MAVSYRMMTQQPLVERLRVVEWSALEVKKWVTGGVHFQQSPKLRALLKTISLSGLAV